MAGKYQGSTATSSATGAANVDRLLWSDNFAAGAVSDENALGLQIHALGAAGDSELWVKINGREIFRESVGAGNTRLRADLDVWRKTTSTADVTGIEYVDNVFGQIPEKAVTGLAWTSSQALEVWGKSTVAGGLVLQRAGVVR